MRVIAGEFRSRKLKTLPGLDTRPTPDRMRESLFNILANRIEGTVFLDAYAGTGSVGIEALSRGASRVLFVERSRAAVEVIRDNISSLGASARTEVFTGKALTVLERLDGDIAFVDPPYESQREYAAALELLADKGWNLVIVQHDAHVELPDEHGRLRRVRIVKQGSNAISIFE